MLIQILSNVRKIIQQPSSFSIGIRDSTYDCRMTWQWFGDDFLGMIIMFFQCFIRL